MFAISLKYMFMYKCKRASNLICFGKKNLSPFLLVESRIEYSLPFLRIFLDHLFVALNENRYGGVVPPEHLLFTANPRATHKQDNIKH